MRKLEVKIRQIIFAIKKSFKPTSYDLVIFKGKEYYIKSSLTGEDVWNLFERNNNKPVHHHVKGCNLKLKTSCKRFVKVFKFHMSFQKYNWQSIDNMNPLGTRLSYLSSENIYFSKNY